MAELSPEEQDILQELNQSKVNIQTSPGHFSEDDDIQRNILGAFLTDRQFCIAGLGLVQPGYFTNEAHQVLCKVLMDYFAVHKNIPPKQFVHQGMEDVITNKKPEIKQYYRTEFNVVYDYFIPGADTSEFLLDRITNFAKAYILKKTFNQSLDMLKKDQTQETWLKIRDMLNDALKIDRNFDMGLDYFQSFEERYARMIKVQEENEIFTSGFAAIDDSLTGGGLSRGEVGSWMGLPGTGKSLALVAAALSNMNLGKRVLYISLEMDQDKVAERFDSQLANRSKEAGFKVTINTLLQNKDYVFASLNEYVKEHEDPRLLIIRQFAAGALDVGQLRSYLTQVKINGFIPDLIILDYVGEMKDYPGVATWESRNKIVRDLRGIAVEEQACILTAMQPDRRARDQSNEKEMLGFIDDSNLADAYGQSRPLDALWSINQFQDEKDCGLARIFVVKHRHGKSRFNFHVEYDYDTLRMSQINENIYTNKLKEYRNSKQAVAQKNAEEDIKKKKMESQIDRVFDLSNNMRNVIQSTSEESGYEVE